MRTSVLVQKNTGFFEIYSVSARTRGVEPVRMFGGQGGRGQFFAILCGRPLWTAPYYVSISLSVLFTYYTYVLA